MRAIRALAARELGALVHTPAGWVVLAGFQLLAGLLFLVILDGYVARAADVLADPIGGPAQTITTHLVAPFVGNLALFLALVGPAVGHRALLTQGGGLGPLVAVAPVSTGQVVAGRFLGTWGATLALVLPTAWMPLAVGAWAPVDLGALALGYAALAGFAAVTTALGLLAGALTDHALAAWILATAVTVGAYVVGLGALDPGPWVALVSPTPHLVGPPRGLLRASDASWFVLVTVWALFAAVQRLDARRAA